MNDNSEIDKLIESIAAGSLTVEHEIERCNINLNEVGMLGRTPLMLASAEGHCELVEKLVRHGASVHAKGRDFLTALHEAASNGQAEVVNYLMVLGANVNASSTDGVTPLMCAAAWGNIEIVKLLMENGADWKKTDNTGSTAEDIALEKGEKKTADLIYNYAQTKQERTKPPPAGE